MRENDSKGTNKTDSKRLFLNEESLAIEAETTDGKLKRDQNDLPEFRARGMIIGIDKILSKIHLPREERGKRICESL